MRKVADTVAEGAKNAGAAAGLWGISLFGRLWRGSSCCGEREGRIRKFPAADKNKAHYRYRYGLSVEGMVCANCVRRVENAFHRTGEMLAEADLKSRTVRLYAKRTLTRKETAALMDAAGYTLTEFFEEEGRQHEVE